jgi:hypothetical protein
MVRGGFHSRVVAAGSVINDCRLTSFLERVAGVCAQTGVAMSAGV